MLFNSYTFIFYFLIPLLGIYLVFTRYIKIDKKIFFIAFSTISIVFYMQWSLEHLVLLLASILFNFLIAKQLSTKFKNLKFLLFSIFINLIPLTYYKYSSIENLVLPLAISFFTFQQIAFLVDVYKDKIKNFTFYEYSFFVLFFPQLIAGPIVHFNDLVGQIKVKQSFLPNISYLSAGMMLFSIGLFSKVVIADNLTLDAYNSWSDVFSYSFMIYFDFSGYASMAIGLALMFGVVLPINFNSPYKSINLIEFWRTWHITLSTFLKEHIYIPLGGNRFGIKKQTFALLITMVIGGIWHGSGVTFLLWGFFHGLGLVVLNITKKYNIFKIVSNRLTNIFKVIFTFLYVSLLWVLFFSVDLHSALGLYKTLFSLDGFKGFNYWLILVACIVWFMPNSTQVIDLKKSDFAMKPYYGYITGLLMFVSLKFMAETPSMKFVYFNF